MTIIKTIKEEKYVTIHNEFFEIPTLSYGAKGLLGYIISKPANWKINKVDLMKRSSCGKTKIEGYLLELMAHGFIYWYAEKNDNGQIEEWIYEVYEMPYLNPNKEACIKEGLARIEAKKSRIKAKNSKKKPQLDNPIVEEKPQLDNPKVDNPVVDNPVVDNPPYSNKDISKKELSKKDINNTYLSLSIEQTEMIDSILTACKFTKREIKKIIDLIIANGLFEVTKHDIKAQAILMASKPDIQARPIYFVNGLEMNIGRLNDVVENNNEPQENYESQIPFYNWLEE